MALGGVTCTFKRELKPYRKYEIWTRVLSWDEKWVYVISHIVKPGTAIPTTYSDQSWRSSENHHRSKGTTASNSTNWNQSRESANSTERSSTLSSVHPSVYAVSVAKYAFKRGRVTISPTKFLQACDLLPVSPSESSGNVSHAPQPLGDVLISSGVDLDPSAFDDLRGSASSKKSVVNNGGGRRRDDLWHILEATRLQYLGIARHMAGLDEGFGLFRVDEDVAFARY